MDITKCQECGEEVAFYLRECHICSADIGFPNVRHAQLEEQYLDNRYKSALASLRQKNLEKRAIHFEHQINSDSSTVIATSVAEIYRLYNSDKQLYATFANQVDGSMRLAENNKWDKLRDSVESMLFPRYWNKITFSALSLSGKGLLHYGKAHVCLKGDLVKKRTSFFEENPFKFANKHQVVTGTQPPEGYRATWEQRGKLAIAKLHSGFNADSSLDENTLMSHGEDSDGDFIEGHTYGPLHPKTFESIYFAKLEPREALLVNMLDRDFASSGVNVVMEEA